jgi:hypothetical protein
MVMCVEGGLEWLGIKIHSESFEPTLNKSLVTCGWFLPCHCPLVNQPQPQRLASSTTTTMIAMTDGKPSGFIIILLFYSLYDNHFDHLNDHDANSDNDHTNHGLCLC